MYFEPKAPLYRDPIWDGAADPVVIWNREEKNWWMLYTNRRAAAINHGVSYIHGTRIGVASSGDGGRTWLYRGELDLEFEKGHNTFWAPEVIWAQGKYHMYVSYVRGIPQEWQGDRHILHYTADTLWDWKWEGVVPLSSERVIDACVYEVRPGEYKLWYKDEAHGSHTYSAVSRDLYHWSVLGPEIQRNPHEGPNVFSFAGKFWMLTDPWHGLDVYSSLDASQWEYRGNILRTPGIRPDDGSIGGHADVVVHQGHAYVFYFTHPQVTEEQRNQEDFVWEYQHRRSSIQVAELQEKDGNLICSRDHVLFSLDPV